MTVRESYSIDEVVKKYGSVSDFISRILSDFEAKHGTRQNVEGGLNWDEHRFKDGYTVRVKASYGFILIEEDI